MSKEEEKQIEIEVEEVNLEDLILLGEDRLSNIKISYPDENGNITVAKAKIKQLTLKELRNINLEKITLETCVKILNKCLFTQEDTPFTQDLILSLPVGVVSEITREVLRISGVETKQLGF